MAESRQSKPLEATDEQKYQYYCSYYNQRNRLECIGFHQRQHFNKYEAFRGAVIYLVVDVKACDIIIILLCELVVTQTHCAFNIHQITLRIIQAFYYPASALSCAPAYCASKVSNIISGHWYGMSCPPLGNEIRVKLGLVFMKSRTVSIL